MNKANRTYQYYYFIGIGGIGMSALARYYHQKGMQVAGYDRSITKLTNQLQAEGIAVSSINEADAIPFPYRNKESTLVVYTPAISNSNPILNYFKEEGFTVLKRAELLGRLSADLPTIAVAGTHGKTTVSTMIAFILQNSGIKINAFLGGISRDFGTNLILHPEAEYMVTEADEFDRSFLKLDPHTAVITSIDADHLDVYSDEADIIASYKAFANRIDLQGTLVTKQEILDAFGLLPSYEKISYATNKLADTRSYNLRVLDGKLHFDLEIDGQQFTDFICGLPGKHNVENATAAIAVAVKLGLSIDEIKSALKEFKGVKRRFDVHINKQDFIYIDDYAHHPNEIEALIESVKNLYPEKKITLIFQPHLYSRTRDFGDEFAAALSKADELILLDLYPAREEAIEGIDSRWLANKISIANVPVCQKSQLIKVLKTQSPEVLLTVGAGDIDTMVEPIIQYYGE